jgi:hypothetical protein
MAEENTPSPVPGTIPGAAATRRPRPGSGDRSRDGSANFAGGQEVGVTVGYGCDPSHP